MDSIAPKLRRGIGYCVLGGLAIYLISAVLHIVVPSALPTKSTFFKYYRWVTLPGPFFTESRIYTPGHLYVATKKKDGAWTAYQNPEAEHLRRYRDSFFQYNSLQQARLTHFYGRMLNKAWKSRPETVVQSKALRQLHAHLRYEYIPDDADSVALLYTQTMRGDTASQAKTLFHFTYKSY